MRKQLRWVVIFTIMSMLVSMVAGCGTQANNSHAVSSSSSFSGNTEPKSDYPKQSIEMVVPFSVGGGSDIFARNIERVISVKKLVPQTITVSNKAGAGGSIGYSYVAEKKGDPYTVATVSSSFYTTPILGQSPVNCKNFTPIAGLAMDTLILVVKADSKFMNVKNIVDEAQAKPKTLNVGGTSGTSDDAVMFYAFTDRTKTEMKYVPFNSGGEVMTAVLEGRVDLAWVNPGEALPQLEAKNVRTLAVASSERLNALKDVPTLKEQGIDLALAQFRGVVAPLDIPTDVVAYWENVIEQVAKDPEWTDGYLKKNMIEGRFLKSQDFAKAIQETTKMYEEFLKKVAI